MLHLALPIAGATAAFFSSVLREGFSLEVLATQFFMTGLFFVAPHLVWFGAARALKLRGASWHSGFVICSLLLVFVGLSPILGRGDPSGLPYHWLLYWPVSIVGLVAAAAVAAITRRRADF